MICHPLLLEDFSLELTEIKLKSFIPVLSNWRGESIKDGGNFTRFTIYFHLSRIFLF